MAWVAQAHAGGVFGALSKDLIETLAKLSGGLAYGIGFGAGLGYTFHACQHRPSGGLK
jgi:hypothetical protein